MIRITEHSRRSGKGKCCSCGGGFYKGESYRQMVMVGEWDIRDDGFCLDIAHSDCVSHNEMWALTADVARADRERKVKEEQLISFFNKAAPVGCAVTVWPMARSGRGREAVTLAPASLRFGGSPTVRIRYSSGGSDYMALSHVEVK